MAKTKKYLAIDLGASSGRGIVGSFDGERLTLRENCRFANEPVKVGYRLYWDILRIFYEIKNSIRRTVCDGDDIISIGIDTWGVDYGLLDKSGRLISNPVHYRDARNLGIEQYVWNKVPFEDIYHITGIQSLNFNTLYQLCAEQRDDVSIFKQADKLLFIPDLLNYFLTGKMATEYTIASTGAVIDANQRTLSSKLLSKLNIPHELFSPLVMPGKILGNLTDELKRELGCVNAYVVNVASHDTASAVIAVPNESENFIYISSGTWSLMGTELDSPVITDSSMRANCTNEGGAQGTIRFLKNIMGLWILQESRRQWRLEGQEYTFAQLEAMAMKAKPFSAFIDPDDVRFATPGNMPARIADYCSETGQYVPQSVGEIVRCIYESLALKYRNILENIVALTSINPSTINIVGGGSQDTLLNKMTASACGISVTAGPTEATAIGNLIVQAIADGEVKDLKEGRELVSRSFPPKTFEPRDTKLWDSVYDNFIKLIK